MRVADVAYYNPDTFNECTNNDEYFDKLTTMAYETHERIVDVFARNQRYLIHHLRDDPPKHDNYDWWCGILDTKPPKGDYLDDTFYCPKCLIKMCAVSNCTVCHTNCDLTQEEYDMVKDVTDWDEREKLIIENSRKKKLNKAK